MQKTNQEETAMTVISRTSIAKMLKKAVYSG